MFGDFVFEEKIKGRWKAKFRGKVTADVPILKTYLGVTYEPTGPYGAKSVSEIGVNGPLPAIANAIADPVDFRLVKPPFTAEKILNGIKELKKSGQWRQSRPD